MNLTDENDRMRYEFEINRPIPHLERIRAAEGLETVQDEMAAFRAIHGS